MALVLTGPALTGHALTGHALTGSLADEFPILSADAVARCVADARACLAHLGIEATPALIERVAREHLVGMVKSEPPSGRCRSHRRPDPGRG